MRNRRRVRLLGILLGVLAAIYFVSLGIYRLFLIKEVAVVGNGAQLVIDSQRMPKNLLFLNSDSIEQDLKRRHPQLEEVRIEKVWPHRMVIHLVIHDSFVVLLAKGAYYALTPDGVVIARTNHAKEPVLQFDIDVPSVGAKITDEGLLKSLDLVSLLGNSIPLSSITKADSPTLQLKVQNTNILIPQQSDMKAKADTLQTLFMGFRMKGIQPAVIDLRYEKPIITK